ncbi:MAG: hypothetical protein ACKO1Y_02980 [Actinomycetota bacterium]
MSEIPPAEPDEPTTGPTPAPMPTPMPTPMPHPPAAPQAPAADRVRMAWQRRAESDYFFDFWSAVGWTILTCGLFLIYIVYQIVRRTRDHNLRRIELLDAANSFAWEQAWRRGLADGLRPEFERVAGALARMRLESTRFRDPVGWAVIASLLGNVAAAAVFVLDDGDLLRHEAAEREAETALAAIYTRLGAPLASPAPQPARAPHNDAARIIVSLLTCGLYVFWWQYDVMTEGNRHFTADWRYEDGLAASVQHLLAA